jgi:hypothetical protein
VAFSSGKTDCPASMPQWRGPDEQPDKGFSEQLFEVGRLAGQPLSFWLLSRFIRPKGLVFGRTGR